MARRRWSTTRGRRGRRVTYGGLDLRRRKIDFTVEPVRYRRILWRFREDSQFLRTTVQAAFALLCVWIGVEFVLFAQWDVGRFGTVRFPASGCGRVPPDTHR